MNPLRTINYQATCLRSGLNPTFRTNRAFSPRNKFSISKLTLDQNTSPLKKHIEKSNPAVSNSRLSSGPMSTEKLKEICMYSRDTTGWHQHQRCPMYQFAMYSLISTVDYMAIGSGSIKTRLSRLITELCTAHLRTHLLRELSITVS